MSLTKFFIGSVIEEIDSPINGKIQVIRHVGNVKLIADGLLQSGGLISQLWQKPLKTIKKHFTSPPMTILMLGLGGGTVVKMLHKYWPQAQITIVEIDPIIIRLAQKHFDLESTPGLTVVEADAISWIKKTHKKQFDLVVIDIFQGSKPEDRLYEASFMKSLRETLTQNGVMICNHPNYRFHPTQTETFIKNAETCFTNMYLVRSLSNLFVIAQ